MAGLLDLHTLMSLQNGWDVYKNSEVYFKELFVGVQDSLLTEWHASLSAHSPEFRAHAAPGAEHFPLVVVKLEGEQLVQEPLGGVGYEGDDGRLREEMLVRQTVLLVVLSKNPELTRALHVVCRAVMQLARNSFLKAGYLDLSYEGAEELEPDEELVAEDMGMFVRKQRWSSQSIVTIPHIEVPATKNWFVLRSDLNQNGNSGGVRSSDES